MSLDERSSRSLSQGQQLARQGQFADAIEIFRGLSSFAPLDPSIDLELGYALKDSGQLKEAENTLKGGLERHPGNIRLFNALGLVQSDLNEHLEALKSFTQAVDAQPGHPGSRSNRARTLLSLDRVDDAIAEARAALALDASLTPALQTLQSALLRSKRIKDALALCDEIAKQAASSPPRMTLRATALEELGRYKEALNVWLDQAELTRSQDSWFNAALAALRLGDYRLGWELWAHRSNQYPQPSSKIPEWSGTESLLGKSLLVYPEQGSGDCIQFVRYLLRVSDLRPRELTLGLPRPLEDLYQGLANVHVLRQGEAIGSPDLQCSLASLPSALLKATGDISIPPPLVPPNLDQDKIRRLSSQLGARDVLRIGLAVSGNANHPNDRNRSIPLEVFAPLAQDKVQLVFLQNHIRDSDRDAAERMDVRCFTDELHDFSAAAALTSCCHMVVSVDSAPAHLAASLGLDTVVLLPYLPDWRWGIDAETTAWYPTIRLLRQDAQRDWGMVVRQLSAMISLRLSGGAEGKK